MVPLISVPSEFSGRVLVAKLGSAGILAELRGVSRVYPALIGDPQVWVEAEELADARELITTDTDDVLAADAPDGADGPGPDWPGRWGASEAWTGVDGAQDRGAAPWRPMRVLLMVVSAVLLASVAIGPRACSPPRTVTSSVAHP